MFEDLCLFLLNKTRLYNVWIVSPNIIPDLKKLTLWIEEEFRELINPLSKKLVNQ